MTNLKKLANFSKCVIRDVAPLTQAELNVPSLFMYLVTIISSYKPVSKIFI